MTVYFIILWEIICKYRSCFGNYEKDAVFMIMSAVLNIVISVVASKNFGLAGIQLGTLIGWFMIGLSRVRQVVGFYFGKSITKYVLKHLLLSLTAFSECVISFFILKGFKVDLIGIIIRVLVWISLPLIINTCISIHNPYFNSFKLYIAKTVKAFLNLVKLKIRKKI